jgi:hypothetical protein
MYKWLKKEAFLCLQGMNSSGIASAGGVGKALADWMVYGPGSGGGEPDSAPVDLGTVDICRFGPFHGNVSFLRDRTVETLGLHYKLAWPGTTCGKNAFLGVRHFRSYEKRCFLPRQARGKHQQALELEPKTDPFSRRAGAGDGAPAAPLAAIHAADREARHLWQQIR